MPIGEPWTDGAEADHLYVSKPYLVSHEFELLRYGDDRGIHFLWLVPVTEAEVRGATTTGRRRSGSCSRSAGSIPAARRSS